MSAFLPLAINDPKLKLQQWLKQKQPVFAFADDDYSSLLICQMLMEEIGGPNDSLSRYIYDVDKREKIDRRHLVTHIGMLAQEKAVVLQIALPPVKKLGVTLSYLRDVITCCD